MNLSVIYDIKPEGALTLYSILGKVKYTKDPKLENNETLVVNNPVVKDAILVPHRKNR